MRAQATFCPTPVDNLNEKHILIKFTDHCVKWLILNSYSPNKKFDFINILPLYLAIIVSVGLGA